MREVKDNLPDLERQRQQLEDNIQKLRKALHHWQTWDAEYEALKEEVDTAPDASTAELSRIREGFEGELVVLREIDDIFGKPGTKSKEQIKNVLERRIDYVTQNIQSLQKQLDTAEQQHSEVTAASQPEAIEEDAEPVTDIIEELDEDDNVISFQLNRPENALPQVQKALEKAGVKDLPNDKAEPESEPPQPSITKPEPTTQASEVPLEPAKPARKGVSFAADTKTEDGPNPQVLSRKAQRVVHIMKDAKEQEKISQQEPVIPDGEDEDDAALRRMMLQYGMEEVGAVVAELQLDEGDYDDDEDEDYDDFEESDEGFEDEDEHGRYTGSVVTPEYRARMLELEKKLGIKSRLTPQSDPNQDGDADGSGSDDERVGRIVVNRQVEVPSASTSSRPAPVKSAPTKSNIKEKQPSEAGAKKGVRFSNSLDIAPNNELSRVAVADVGEREKGPKKEPLVEPLSDIVERSSSARPAAAAAKGSGKPSRFKKSRGETKSGPPSGPLDAPARFLDQDRPIAPTGPEGSTISDVLVERDTPAAPRIPDEFDDDIMQHAVADEYHRMRNKFIQREGGFLKEDQSPIRPLDETEGGSERMSRFKAARLSKH